MPSDPTPSLERHAAPPIDVETHAANDDLHGHRPVPARYARFARAVLNDARDWPFIPVALQCSLVLPLAAALFVLRRFPWWLGAAYVAFVVLGLTDRFVLMLHNTSHRPVCRKRYRALNHVIPWLLGPFFGESPQSYFVHHVGMHHPENNMESDASSTLRYQRDSFVDFLSYFFRFLSIGIVELVLYLRRRRRAALVRKLLTGELTYMIVIAALAVYSWQATLTVFVLPLVIVRFLMMAGNWGQHAFIDHAAPSNSYLNSITCVDSRYNRRCFNDGYHIGHHLKATMHWSELPGELSRNRLAYGREGALVFANTDFFLVWLSLMTGCHRRLARHYVHVGSGPAPSVDEIVALMRARLRPIASLTAPAPVPELVETA
jgi:fatty acid desaturase